MAEKWLDVYQRHFQHYFQKPFDIQVYHSPDHIGLKLATHDWAMQGFRIYASLGMADHLFRAEQEDFGEVILFADAPDREVPRIFVNALFFILQNNIPLGARFSIGFSGAGGDFVRRYRKTALYFTRPAEKDDPMTEVFQGETLGRVYQAYFITPEEDEFLETKGPDKFEEEFWKQFSDELSDEERLDLSVDKARAAELQARQQELRQRTARAFSLRRPSCV